MNIYHFNPTCEYAINNGTDSWQPNIILQKMEAELALLTTYIADSNDYVISPNLPSKEFKNRTNLLGVKAPNYICKHEISDISKSNIEINKLLPWGWSPVEHRFLNPLKPFCSENFQKSPVFNWRKEHKNLYSKKFAIEILNQVLAKLPVQNLILHDQVGMVCTTKTEIEKRLKKWGKLMIKAPWSSSGRGLQPISKTPVHEKVWEKILGIIQDQGYVIVEPLFDKIFDMALQFEMNKGKVKLLGISNFVADKKGQYQGNFLNGKHERIQPEIVTISQFVLKNISPVLIDILEGSDLAIHYEGNFGVDMLVFRDNNQNLKINPCLEINVRQNMGLLSLHLERLIESDSQGMFRTFYNPKKSFFDFAKEMETNYPLSISNKKIQCGFFPLTDFNKETMFGAYLLID